MSNESRNFENAQRHVLDVHAKTGKSGGWPKCFDYKLSSNGVVQVAWILKSVTDDEWRRFDCWAVAFFLEIKEKLGKMPAGLHFNISCKEKELPHNENAKFEAFRRRISYLHATHKSLDVKLNFNDNICALYSADELKSRPKTEVIREKYNKRGDDDKGERLEKDLQAFLSGKNLKDKEERCDRLALLGEDFLHMKHKKNWGVDREFPTGAFKDGVAKKNRILPTEYVDLISLNKYGCLSVIELKVDDVKLEVISQLLDYALFFRSYMKQLHPVICDRLKIKSFPSEQFNCYVANNRYHPKFNVVANFYGEGSKDIGFKLIKLTFGAHEEIG